MIKSLFYILLAYLLGEVVSGLIGGFVPGSIIGMVLLFCALQLKVVTGQEVRPAAQGLLDNMMLFFVPVSVGLMGTIDIIGDNFLPMLIIVVITTLLVIGAVGWLQQRVGGTKR